MLVRTDSLDPIASEPIRPIAIPGHPEVMGTLLTFRDGDQTVQQVTLISAHGPFDRFVPTVPVEMAALPLDPTALVARTLPVKTDPNALVNATYEPPGYLHLGADPDSDGRGTGRCGRRGRVDRTHHRLPGS